MTSLVWGGGSAKVTESDGGGGGSAKVTESDVFFHRQKVSKTLRAAGAKKNLNQKYNNTGP